MRTDRVVVHPPAFDDNLGFFQRVGQLPVEQLIAHRPVKRFAVAILPRCPRLDIEYFERARTRYLEERGLSVAGLMNEGTVFIVVHAEADCRAPARYGETLVIETIVSD